MSVEHLEMKYVKLGSKPIERKKQKVSFQVERSETTLTPRQ